MTGVMWMVKTPMRKVKEPMRNIGTPKHCNAEHCNGMDVPAIKKTDYKDRFF